MAEAPIVAGEAIEADPIAPTSKVGGFSLLIASPRGITSIVFLGVLFVVVIALILAVVVNIRVQHPPLLANGALVAGLLVALVLLNRAIALASGSII